VSLTSGTEQCCKRIYGQNANISCKIHLGISFLTGIVVRADLGFTFDVLAAWVMRRYIFWDMILDYIVHSFALQKIDLSMFGRLYLLELTEWSHF
jgi:hypothetical protein